MLKLFRNTDRDFTSNGDKIIQAVKAKITKQDNGEFYLDLETDLSYVDYITEGLIIVAPTPQGEQPFRISNVQKTKTKITSKCYHVFFDSKNYLIEDSYVVEKSCNDALDHLNMATEPTSQFTTISDLETVASFRCVRKSLYEAVSEVLARWGGHLDLNGFEIGIREQIGQDNGVVVRYGKNVKDITCQTDWSGVVTKLLPVGKEELMLPETYVNGKIQYALPHVKTVTFSQDEIVAEDYGTDEDYQAALVENLRQQAQDYVNQHCTPQINYTLKANLEKVTDIGDTVQVIDERLGITVTTNVISYIYDCILGRYIELEFGNFKNSLSKLTSNIASQTQEIVKTETEPIKTTLSDELIAATNRIWEMLGSSYVIYEGDKILVVDSLPKETATNVIMINNGGIAFSQTGINGTFNSAWTIDGTFNAQVVNMINMTADLIKGGTLKLGSNKNDYGILELYDETNTLISLMDKNGLRIYGQDGSYVLINNTVGFAGYDRNGEKIYWADKDEFHMKKAVVEEEITLCNKLRMIPITITDGNGNITNDGIGWVSVGEE